MEGRQFPPLAQQEWDRAVGSFRGQIESINRRIADYNLEAPALSLHMVPLDPEQEIAAVLQSRPDTGPDNLFGGPE